MARRTPFFDGFNRALFGRKPVSELRKLDRLRGRVAGICATQLDALFGTFLPAGVVGAKPPRGANSRERVFTPLVTFWAFLSQVFDPGSPCSKAVARVQALIAASGGTGPSGATGAYCTARRRLPVRMLVRVRDHIASRLCREAPGGGRWLVLDGTAVTMPDTADNQARYPQQRSQKPGCGFPTMKLVGLFDLWSGAWLACARSHLRIHESRMFRRLYRHLRRGDTVVTGRRVLLYWSIAELAARGVDVVMRNHQARKSDFRKGLRLGKGDHIVEWEKPQRARWMDRETYTAMPEKIVLRKVRCREEKKGFRSAEVILVTTLLEPAQMSKEKLGAVYLRRWRVELYFDDIKTTMGMDVLRTKSPEMVCRELLHMIAYNLVRAIIARSGGRADEVSFKGAADKANVWAPLFWTTRRRAHMRCLAGELLATVAEDIVKPRPGRREPRAVKKRPKTYQLMTKPRHEMVEVAHRGKKKKAA